MQTHNIVVQFVSKPLNSDANTIENVILWNTECFHKMKQNC
jgi:hypothetical protein